MEITISKESSRDVGGCNACTKHIGVDGMTRVEVWNIALRGMSFRVCEACKKELLRLLAEAK